MLNNPPLVSVGIPTFNRSKALKRAVDSVINQTYQNIEIIVSDNCSTDKDVQTVMNEFAADSRVKFTRQLVNKGAVFNFNFLLTKATGDFFLWLADDDWLDLNYIESCLSFLLKYPDYAAVYGFAKIHSLTEELVDYDIKISLEHESERERIKCYLENVSYNGCFSALFRRVHMSHLELKSVLAEDWIIVSRIAFLGKYKMLDTTNKHISNGGLSSSIENITRHMSAFTRSFPYLAIALNIAADIVKGSEVFKKYNIFQRFRLAEESFLIVYRRFNVRRELILGLRKFIDSNKS